ncbi:hypothetical protein BKG95_09750 [Rodentibacter pneumotropicus]|uniref:Uncharacterized protein n=1 Tax=Rodentibacter pneumotropicus TaxID=758 RepID=A0AAW5L9R9_9PAST|nr:hypothetical protein [Rodentibacter pneumotropicus]MCQ9120502.1 hypothetical protein [Rodentibacter pneumotropicus]OOF66759.1 hypothetical protein BKG95_09750 [Rodentibacter pneumotropicus]
MPEYSKKYIARHIKFISPDVIEVQRPISPMIRFFIFVFYIVFMIIAFIDYQSRSDISNQDIFDAFFYPEKIVNRKYQEYINYVTEDLNGKTYKENKIKLFQPSYKHDISEPLTDKQLEYIYSYRNADLDEYLNKECFILKDYRCAQSVYFKLYDTLEKIKTPEFEEFKKTYPDLIPNLQQWGYTFFLSPLFLLLFLALIPNQRPVRIDKRKKIAYLQSWGRFYIYKIPEVIFKHKKYNYSEAIIAHTLSFNNGIFFSKIIVDTDLGHYLLPMIYNEKPRVILLGLPAEKKESIIVRQIGSAGIREGELMDFIEDFLLSENEDFYSIYSPIKSKNCFYNLLSFTLFPISYNEAKTLERTEKWLNKPSNNEESQNFAKAKAIYHQIEKKVDKALIRKIILVVIMTGIASLIQTLRLRGLL